jgi:hypothetical protein
MKLNGWQRLWLLLAGVYLIPVVVIGVLLWPSEKSTEQLWNEKIDKLIHNYAQDLSRGDSIRSDFKCEKVLDRYIGDIDSDHEEKRLTAKRVEASCLQLGLIEKELATFKTKQRNYIFYVFGIWVLPLVFILLMGYGIRWVRKGFQNG